VSKSNVNTLTGEELITKDDRLEFMQKLCALKEIKIGKDNYSNIGYADFQLKLLGFDSDIYTQFLLESLKINKRTLELLSNEFLGTKNAYDLWTVESVFKNPQITDKIKFYNNPVLRITETKAKNITYQIGRKVQIPGCKEELLIEEIKDSDIVLQGLACRYVLSKSYVERYNPPNNLEKLMTFKDKSSKVIEKTIFAMESFAVMTKQFGKLDMIYQDGVPKYIIKPHANIIIDPRENGYEHYGGTDNKYYPAFSRIKELGYKIIDLDNPEQKKNYHQYNRNTRRISSND